MPARAADSRPPRLERAGPVDRRPPHQGPAWQARAFSLLPEAEDLSQTGRVDIDQVADVFERERPVPRRAEQPLPGLGELADAPWSSGPKIGLKTVNGVGQNRKSQPAQRFNPGVIGVTGKELRRQNDLVPKRLIGDVVH